MRRAGEARLARADVGHAKIVVPDETRRVACRVALLVNKLDGKSYYTARSNEKWNELGEAYTAKRREIRREYAEE